MTNECRHLYISTKLELGLGLSYLHTLEFVTVRSLCVETGMKIKKFTLLYGVETRFEMAVLVAHIQTRRKMT